jgi:hypothetical protein
MSEHPHIPRQRRPEEPPYDETVPAEPAENNTPQKHDATCGDVAGELASPLDIDAEQQQRAMMLAAAAGMLAATLGHIPTQRKPSE